MYNVETTTRVVVIVVEKKLSAAMIVERRESGTLSEFVSSAPKLVSFSYFSPPPAVTTSTR